MAVTAQAVKELRDATGAGMMDAKKALTEASGDPEAAKQILRERGLAKAGARAGRDSDQGAVAVARRSDAVAVVELRCETDFSAKNEDFTALADALADAVLAGGPGSVEGYTGAIDDLRLKLKEHIEVGAVELVQAAEGNRLDTYLHVQDGRGVNAVVVEGRGVEAEDLHKVALHVAFARPRYLGVEEVPADEVERERVALTEITKAEGKPEKVLNKIVEGRLRAWYGERVLLEQGLYGDKTLVRDSLGGGSVVRFVQVVVGA